MDEDTDVGSHKQVRDASEVRLIELRLIMTDNFPQISMERHN